MESEQTLINRYGEMEVIKSGHKQGTMSMDFDLRQDLNTAKNNIINLLYDAIKIA